MERTLGTDPRPGQRLAMDGAKKAINRELPGQAASLSAKPGHHLAELDGLA